MASIAESFHSSKGSREGFSLESEHFAAIKSLRNNDRIVITRPDKGQGVVLMEKTDYIAKTTAILQDRTKFKILGDCKSNDNTVKLEKSMQNLLRRLHQAGELPESVYERIRPSGSVRPRMYGVPKINKAGAPLRPILAMVGSAQHATAHWLAELLKPVL